MYRPEYVSTFYDAYGAAEWDRLESGPYGRLQALIHSDLLARYVRHGARVLDVGSGPGRFAVVCARIGARVTVVDISQGQLNLARKTIGACSWARLGSWRAGLGFVSSGRTGDIVAVSSRVVGAVGCAGSSGAALGGESAGEELQEKRETANPRKNVVRTTRGTMLMVGMRAPVRFREELAPA